MNVAYLVVGEDLNSPLLRRQVVELLCLIKRKAPAINIKVIWFLTLPTMINHRKDIQEVKSIFHSAGVKINVIPNLTPWPLPNPKFVKTDIGFRPNSIWSAGASKFFQYYAFLFLSLYRFIGQYKVFHCRSYPATLAACFLKDKLNERISVIFDPRSDFPEENVTSGVWATDSKDFHFWKNREKWMLETANYVACISETYVSHFKRNTDDFSYFIAPNNVACSIFERKVAHRVALRKEYNIADNELVFLYVGGMSSGGWHRPEFYVKFYDALRLLSEDIHFFFIVPRFSSALVRAAFSNRKNIHVVSPDLTEVGRFMSVADYGMMFFHEPKIAVGTKIGEYLSASLPIVVNKNCIGACDIISQMPQLGIEFNLGLGGEDNSLNVTQHDFNKLLSKLDDLGSLNSFALAHFDNSIVASAYIKKYQQLES